MKIIIIILLWIAVTQAQYTLVPANNLIFSQPTELVNANDSRMFLCEQTGKIYVYENTPNQSVKKVFLDLSSLVGDLSPYSGVLGLAFHPNYINNRYFYVKYAVDTLPEPVTRHFRLKISRFQRSLTNPDSAVLSSELNLINIYALAEHFGGTMTFKDGLFYTGIGDGAMSDSAQFTDNLYGKILRINVDNSANGKNYSIPVSNPFQNEVFAYGLRNPFKFSFDNNVMWVGDVGADKFEEINKITIGGNYGWNNMEGNQCHPDTTSQSCFGQGYINPFFQYRHRNVGQTFDASITGGYVYRGFRLRNLIGKYIYAEFVLGTVWALNPLMVANETLIDSAGFWITSFGLSQDNEIYLTSFKYGGVFEAKVFRLIPNNPCNWNLDMNEDNTIDISDAQIIDNGVQSFATGRSDVNGDGITDLTDLTIFNNCTGITYNEFE